MKITLQNCFNDKVEFEVETKNFQIAKYEIISGDEVLTVYYKNGSEQTFDSDKHLRIENRQDYEVHLCNVKELKLINQLPFTKDPNSFFANNNYERCYALTDLLTALRASRSKK